MENLFKYFSGGLASMLALLAPVRPMIICAMIFIAIDFITGVAASYKRARVNGLPWGFESRKAWTTVAKAACVMAGIVLSWIIDTYLLAGLLDISLARIFTGFVCGVEFWSYLENAAEVSDHPVFLWLKRFMKKKISEKLNTDDDDQPWLKE